MVNLETKEILIIHQAITSMVEGLTISLDGLGVSISKTEKTQENFQKISELQMMADDAKEALVICDYILSKTNPVVQKVYEEIMNNPETPVIKLNDNNIPNPKWGHE